MTTNQRSEHTDRMVGRTLRLALGIALVCIVFSPIDWVEERAAGTGQQR